MVPSGSVEPDAVEAGRQAVADEVNAAVGVRVRHRHRRRSLTLVAPLLSVTVSVTV